MAKDSGRVSSKGGSDSGRVSSKGGSDSGRVSSGRVSSSSSSSSSSGGRVSSKGGSDSGRVSSGRVSSSSSSTPSSSAAKGSSGKKRDYLSGEKFNLPPEEEDEAAAKGAASLAAQRAMRTDVISNKDEQQDETEEESKKEKQKKLKIEQQLSAAIDSDIEEATITFAGSSRLEDTEPVEVGDSINIQAFTLSFKGQDIFHEATVSLAKGFRYGLVGANGSGKSTFLRYFATRKLPGIPERLDMLHVEQEVEGTDQPAIEAVLSADTVRLALLAEKAELEAKLQQTISDEADTELQAKLAALYEEIAVQKIDSAPGRAASILGGLQFTPEMQRKPTKEFSGGWRMRIALARALFMRPTLLLLDEPTNHLDLHAVVWLQEYLKRWKKTLVIVSHDRAFLNEVCNRIIHVNNRKLNTYKGTFNDFTLTFDQQKREQDNAREKQQRAIKELNKMKHGDQSKGGGGKKSKGAGKQAKSAIDRKEKQVQNMKEQGLIERMRDYRVSFPFPSPDRILDHPCIKVEDVSFSYTHSDSSDQDEDSAARSSSSSSSSAAPVTIFTRLHFGIGMKSRIALVGPNGSGKSTLLGLLFGKLKPTSGSVTINHSLRIGFFSQHFADQLEFDVSPVMYLHSMFPEEDYEKIRKYLGKFGLAGKHHLQSIKSLSGGQKNRVLYAKLALSKPDLLYLDEPTNHLDMESIEALSDSLSRDNFAGGVIIVSHDARLIHSVCGENADDEEGQTGQIWVIGDKDCKPFNGTIFDYRSELIDKLDKDEIEAAT